MGNGNIFPTTTTHAGKFLQSTLCVLGVLGLALPVGVIGSELDRAYHKHYRRLLALSDAKEKELLAEAAKTQGDKVTNEPCLPAIPLSVPLTPTRVSFFYSWHSPLLQDKDKDKQNQQHWGLTFLNATTTLTIGSLARVGLFANNNNYDDEDDKDKGLLHRTSTQPKLTALVRHRTHPPLLSLTPLSS